MAPVDFVRNGQTILTRSIASNPAAAFDGATSKARASCALGAGNAGACEVGIDLGSGNSLLWIGGRVYAPNNSPFHEHGAGQSISFTLYAGNDPAGSDRVQVATISGTQAVGQVLTFPNASGIQAQCIWVSSPQAPPNDGTDWAQFKPVYDDQGGGPPPPPPPPPPPTQSPGTPIDWTIAIGQSEIAGPAPLQDASAYYYAASCVNYLLAGQIVPAVEPLNPLSDTSGTDFSSGRMGPCMPYLDERAKLVPGRRAGIILRSRGSSGLGTFAPGSSLYTRTVADALAALAASPAGSRIVALICQQGESGPSSGWDTLFLQIVNAYKSDLQLPGLLSAFVVVDPRFGSTAAVQKAMQLPYGMARVTLDDLPIPGSGDLMDPLLFRTVGKRLAWAILGMSTVAY